MKSNASLIKTDRTSIVASELYESERGLLTFVNHFVAAFGLIFNVDVYGFIDSTLNDHLILHCKETLSLANSENVLIRCFCRDGTDWKFVTTLMKSFGLEELEKAGTGQILCEQKVNKVEVPKFPNIKKRVKYITYKQLIGKDTYSQRAKCGDLIIV